ncbi:hypothetical protein C6P44_000562 [Monosporozyma unispora]|nr:hypothetical protein C6P44_000562 [Kazachstania unispora]
MLLDKYHKRFNMFSHKHRHNKSEDEDINMSNNSTNNNSNSNNNNNDIPMMDPIILPESSSASDETFVDPRLQYNMVTPINSNNIYSASNGNVAPNNNLYNLQQPQFNYGKFNGSTTSLASSLNSEYTLPQTNSLSNSLTKQFISLLMEIYQLLSSDPTVTPFDTTNPPSGILNRVGKLAIEKANSNNLDILNNGNAMMMNSSTLLALIRHHLLTEIRKDGYLSRNVSLSSLPQQSIFNNIPTQQQQQQFSLQQQQPMLKRTNTMDRVQNNITNITGGNVDNTNGLGIGLGSSINLNVHPGLSNINPLLSRSLSRTSSPLATKPRNYNYKP